MVSVCTSNKNKTNRLHMKRIVSIVLVSLVGLVAHAATLTFNDTQVAIFGSGNPDTGWTTSNGGGVELSLRGKDRVSGSTANVNGVYSYPTGTVPPANNRAVWNWEWNIDTGTATLGTYDYFLGIDTDPSAAIAFSYVDPLTFWNDNSYGTSGTANGAGLEGPFGLFGSSTIAQQSQNLVFVGGDPNLDATYNYELFAVLKGAGLTGDKLAGTKIQVEVGRGGTRVPDSLGMFPALFLGAGIIGFLKRRRP